MTEAIIREALRHVVDPELGINIIDLGLVYRIEIQDTRVRVVMTMTSRACPLGDYLKALVDSTIGLVRLGWNLPLPWPDQLIA